MLQLLDPGFYCFIAGLRRTAVVVLPVVSEAFVTPGLLVNCITEAFYTASAKYIRINAALSEDVAGGRAGLMPVVEVPLELLRKLFLPGMFLTMSNHTLFNKTVNRMACWLLIILADIDLR